MTLLVTQDDDDPAGGGDLACDTGPLDDGNDDTAYARLITDDIGGNPDGTTRAQNKYSR